MGICGIRYNRIGGGEAGDAGNVVPRVVVDEAEVVVVLLAGVAVVCKGLGGGGAVAAEGEVAGAAAGNHAATVIVAHDAIAAEVVAVQVQQVVGLARDDLPHGDGLPGKEVDAALDDGVAALDAAAVVVGRLRALRHGGGSFLVGKRPGVGPGAGLDAVFVLAGADAPGVAVGDEEQLTNLLPARSYHLDLFRSSIRPIPNNSVVTHASAIKNMTPCV